MEMDDLDYQASGSVIVTELEGDIEVNKKDEVIEVNKIIMKKVSEILKLYIFSSRQ